MGGLSGLEAGPGGDAHGVHHGGTLDLVEAPTVECAWKALLHEAGGDNLGIAIGDALEDVLLPSLGTDEGEGDAQQREQYAPELAAPATGEVAFGPEARVDRWEFAADDEVVLAASLDGQPVEAVACGGDVEEALLAGVLDGDRPAVPVPVREPRGDGTGQAVVDADVDLGRESNKGWGGRGGRGTGSRPTCSRRPRALGP